MNISEALIISELSPENVTKILYSALSGFNEAETREMSIFDMYLVFAFINYPPAVEEFTKNLVFNKNSSFIQKIDRQPYLYANINERFNLCIEYVKDGLIYGMNENIFSIDNNFIIKKNTKKLKVDRAGFNVGKVFSTKTTKSLYDYFKVDINAI